MTKPESGWGQGGQVPAGMVGVCACVGGRADNGQYGGTVRWFMVPAAEYAARGRYSFIVDPARHTECGDFTKREVA